jgi:hypothetical protein
MNPRQPATPAGRRILLAAAVSAAGLAAAAGLYVLSETVRDAGPTVTGTAAEDVTALTPAEAGRRGDELVASLLDRIYQAFEREDEGAIYDALAEAAAGDALEALYLQRRAALADRGLLADQEVHEVEMLAVEVARDGDRLRADARWRVLGLVGHEQHRHMRGNAYAADLMLEQRDGLWRVTGFDLRDVDRTEAGVIVDAPPGDAG